MHKVELTLKQNYHVQVIYLFWEGGKTTHKVLKN